MNVALSLPWTIERFLDWAEAQEERYEFDGTAPVLMTGGNARHGRINLNLHAALRSRLRGSSLDYHGPALGIQTIGNAVRYPDALVASSRVPDLDRLASGVLAIFEVVSPTSRRIDRVTRRNEYAAIPSVRHYVIIDSTSRRVTVLHRNEPDQPWTETDVDVVDLANIGISIPVPELYEDVAFDS